jgi:hypothetical protein
MDMINNDLAPNGNMNKFIVIQMKLYNHKILNLMPMFDKLVNDESKSFDVNEINN